MELKEAKNKLESEGYKRKLVYRLTYTKDGIWENAYFTNKEDADVMVSKMMEVNKMEMVEPYSYISVNKYTWEIFVEPWQGGVEKPPFIVWMNNKIEILFVCYTSEL